MHLLKFRSEDIALTILQTDFVEGLIVASFYKHALGPAAICLSNVNACKDNGFEPFKPGWDKSRHSCREVMLMCSMLIRGDCTPLPAFHPIASVNPPPSQPHYPQIQSHPRLVLSALASAAVGFLWLQTSSLVQAQAQPFGKFPTPP